MPIFPTGYTQKSNPHDDDQVLIGDSQASNAIKRTKISSIITKASAAALVAISSATDWITSSMLKDGSVTRSKIGFEDWEELARVTATAIEANLSSGTIPAKKYLRFRFAGVAQGGTYAYEVRFNNDAATKYSDRVLYLSGTSVVNVTGPSRSAIRASVLIPSGGAFVSEGEIVNVAGWTKLAEIRHVSEQVGVAVSNPTTMEYYSGKYIHNTGPITQIDIIKSSGTSGMAVGSELIIEGRN